MRVIDGDTVAFGDVHVRLLGIDTPEIGECGFEQATAFARRFLRGGGRMVGVSGLDRYGRTLAYVHNRRDRDLGLAQIRHGWAVARYDSTDGYDWHLMQERYHAAELRRPRPVPSGQSCG